MQQLHDMHTFFPHDPKTVTKEERRKALKSLTFLKEKKSGEIKGTTCIKRAPQREYIRKEDAALPIGNHGFVSGKKCHISRPARCLPAYLSREDYHDTERQIE